ncbi:MAG: ATP-binding protein [Phocaeicola sp.]
MIITEKEQLCSLATELKLLSVKESLEEMVETSGKQGWSQIEFVRKLLEGEVNRRNENRKQQRVKAAHFFGLKYLEELERDELPIEAAQILPVLETLEFIKQGRNSSFPPLFF